MSDTTVRCAGMRGAKRKRYEETHHNRVNGRMDAQSFTNDTVEDREFFHFFVCHRAKCSVWVGEMFHLFLI